MDGVQGGEEQMPQDFNCIADVARRQAQLRPDAEALWFEGRSTTYAEFDRLSSQCAQALIAAGVRPGERVGHLAKGNDHFFVLWFGCLKAGACLNPVNWRLAPPEMAFILKDAGCRVLVVGDDYADTIEALDLPEIHTIIQFEAGHAAWPDFSSWISAHPDADPQCRPAADDDVIQLYTSGTTGLPKGVQLTEANFANVFEAAVSSWARFEPGEGVLVLMPLFHIAGANVGLLALYQGARSVVMREVDVPAALRTIEGQRVRHGVIVPAVINMMLQHPACAEADLSSMTRIYYGASPISEDVLQRARARFAGAEFTQVYGMTESTAGGTYLRPEMHDPALGKLRSCGVPTPGFEIRIRNDGRDAAVGEVGEIEMRSPGIMKGYWNRPEATAEAIDAEGWFKTGDAGYFDADGFLFMHDRVKDMIVTGGENVYPAEVENALFAHPSVADAAVIGVPDDRWGEAVKAVVVLKPGAEADPAAILAHCRERIAGYKVPKSVDFAAALPRNPSGKVLRRELREP